MMKPDEIRRLRHRIGWTLRQMAEYLEVSPGTVSRWENGERGVDPWREQVLYELKERADALESKQQRHELGEALARAAITAGLIGFLTYLLTRNDDQEADSA